MKKSKNEDVEKNFLIEKHNRVLSMISHDLKSPLVAITGLSNLLRGRMKKEEDQNPQWIDWLERISRAGEDTQRLVNNILAMAKMEAGKEEVQPEWVADISKELSEIKKTFEHETSSKRIRFTVEILSPLPKVRWDMNRLRYHVLNNLISNSLKFTPAGGRVTLSAELVFERVLLRVKDTGPGIPPGERDKIFHRFEQMELKTKRVFNSAGLGLHNASLFVIQHGGRISMDNSTNSGASFLIELPIDALVKKEDLKKKAA